MKTGKKGTEPNSRETLAILLHMFRSATIISLIDNYNRGILAKSDEEAQQLLDKVDKMVFDSQTPFAQLDPDSRDGIYSVVDQMLKAIE